MNPISHVLLSLTYRCNLRCGFCLSFNSYWRPDAALPLPAAVEPRWFLRRAPNFREMTTADIVERVLPQCEACGVQTIALSGGEVLVRRDAADIFRALGESSRSWCMDSNLILCDESIAETIVGSGCDRVHFSLDGSREVQNELRRNPQGYEKAIGGLGNLVAARRSARASETAIQINFVLQPGNEAEPPAMIRVATGDSVDEVSFQLLSERQYRMEFDAATAAASLAEAFATAEELGVNASIYPAYLLKAEDLRAWYASPADGRFYSKCSYILNDLRIDPEGNVIPCLEYAMGNVLQQDLIDIWMGAPYQAFRRHLSCDGPFAACLRCCNMEPRATVGGAVDSRPHAGTVGP